MKQTVFFVGIHNKPDMKPLDSKTASGRLIDQISSQLDIQVVKTNLHGSDYQPVDDHEIYFDARVWHDAYSPRKKDIVVLLGKHVSRYFIEMDHLTVKIQHPAVALYSGSKRKQYIEDSVNIIKSQITCHS